jgi:hypothetical protein
MSTKFHTVCNNEMLWYNKTAIEYPQFLGSKPNDTKWKNCFILISSKMLPLYYNGDRIAFIHFNVNMLSDITNILIDYINQIMVDVLDIVFVNENFEP